MAVMVVAVILHGLWGRGKVIQALEVSLMVLSQTENKLIENTEIH